MKKIGLTLLVIIVLLIVVALIIPFMIPDSTFKTTIISRVQSMTGRELKIDGRLRVKLFPFVGIYAENVAISNNADFPHDVPFMTLKALDVNVKLLPLLFSHEVVIKSLVLDEPKINLAVNGSGKNNWSFAGKPEAAQASANPAPSSAVNSNGLPTNMLLSDVKLNQGDIVYNNAYDKNHWEVKAANLTVSLNGYNSPLKIDGGAEWNQKPVAIALEASPLQNLLAQKSANVSGSVKTELLTVTAQGVFNGADTFAGKTSIVTPSLKQLLVWLKPGQKPLALDGSLALNVNSDMVCSRSRCELNNAKIALDKVEAAGNIRMAYGVSAPVPTIDINVTTNQLDFNQFITAPASPHASNNPLVADALAEPASGWSEEAIDLSMLNRLNVTAVLQPSGVHYRNITLGKSTLQAKLLHGRLNVTIVDAEIYGGKGNITFDIDSGNGIPMVDGHAIFADVNAAPFLKDALDMSRFSGKANISVNLASRGRSQKELVSLLAGNGQVKFINGAIKGISLLDMMRSVQSALAPVENNAAKKTDFSELSGSFTIAQGVVTNKDLSIAANLLHITGQGQVDLPSRTISYHLIPSVAGATAADGSQKQGVSVPIIIEGSIDHPSYRPDVGNIIQDAIKDPKKFKEQLNNSRDAIKEQLKKPNANNLKGLLKGL